MFFPLFSSFPDGTLNFACECGLRARTQQARPPKERFDLQWLPTAIWIGLSQNFPGRHESSSSPQSASFSTSPWEDDLDADGGIMVSQARGTVRHSKQTAGRFWRDGVALLRVKPPSSLLTHSCLLSSSPDARVRVCSGREGGFWIKDQWLALMAYLFSLHRQEANSECFWINYPVTTKTCLDFIYNNFLVNWDLHF